MLIIDCGSATLSLVGLVTFTKCKANVSKKQKLHMKASLLKKFMYASFVGISQ